MSSGFVVCEVAGDTGDKSDDKQEQRLVNFAFQNNIGGDDIIDINDVDKKENPEKYC